ncbi:hypothetical protein DFH08DRAFT_865958 [Mycena albidolilacea]|uniref:Uncharacterized protein n=1 Tax=Mycena albidolilacea TaxID=1033008 RepID=A0AAD7A3Z3_9AGAR|nr:hypothetical protein DFH08DRAFT_865958 [Mycena albidolilacea]
MRTRTENNSAADKKNSHSTASRCNKKNGCTSAPAPLGTHADTAGTGDEQVHELQVILQLRSMQSALDRSHEAERAAEARSAATVQHTAAPLPSDVWTGSVGCPNNIASQHLGFDDMQWNALWTCVCDALSAARLDLSTKWKAQAPAKLSMVYNASYRSCVGNQTTYCGRRTAACRTTGSDAAGLKSRVRVAAASMLPHPCCRIHHRSTSHSDSDSCKSMPVAGLSHDNLLTFSDDGNDNEDRKDGDEEDLEDSNPKGKKHAAPAAER